MFRLYGQDIRINTLKYSVTLFVTGALEIFNIYDVNTFQVSPVKISLGTLEKYGIRMKSAHDTGTEGQHQPRSCSHLNHYVTSGLPQRD